MSEVLEFLDEKLPDRLDDAVARIKEIDVKLLAAYDKNVLGRYDIGRHLRYLMDSEGLEACSIEITKRFFGEKASPRIIASSIIGGAKKGRDSSRKLLPLYAARVTFTNLMRQHSGLVSDAHGDLSYGLRPKFNLDIEATAYGLRLAYETLCEMVLQTARGSR
jgi:hypothetical protein